MIVSCCIAGFGLHVKGTGDINILADLVSWCWSLVSLIAAVTIGFVQSSYSVGEEGNSINLEVAVLAGSLESAITVELSTAGGTANCEFYTTVWCPLSELQLSESTLVQTPKIFIDILLCIKWKVLCCIQVVLFHLSVIWTPLGPSTFG